MNEEDRRRANRELVDAFVDRVNSFLADHCEFLSFTFHLDDCNMTETTWWTYLTCRHLAECKSRNHTIMHHARTTLNMMHRLATYLPQELGDDASLKLELEDKPRARWRKHPYTKKTVANGYAGVSWVHQLHTIRW